MSACPYYGLATKYLADVQQLEAGCSDAEKALWPPSRPRDNLIESQNFQRLENIAALIVYTWRLHNIRHPRTRLTILVLFVAGFVLIGTPAIVTFFQVTTAGLRSWLQATMRIGNTFEIGIDGMQEALQWSKANSAADAATQAKAESRTEAKAKGYEDEICSECGNLTPAVPA